MAYAIVGSMGTVATGTGTCAPSFAQATTAGNLLIAWLAQMDAGDLSTATTPSGWSLGKSQSALGPYIFYKANCGAGETAPTLGNAANTGGAAGCLAEFSGGATTSPLDQTGSSGVIGLTPKTATNAAVDATSGSLMVSSQGWQLSKAGTDTTTDTYTNATATGNLNNDATSTTNHYRFAYGITTANAVADADTATNASMNSNGGIVVLASFKLAPAVFQPRPPGVNFNDPGLFMEKRNWLWLPKRPRLWRPDLWTPPVRQPIPAIL